MHFLVFSWYKSKVLMQKDLGKAQNKCSALSDSFSTHPLHTIPSAAWVLHKQTYTMGEIRKDVAQRKEWKKKLYLCISKAALGHLSIYVHGTRWHLLCISKAALGHLSIYIHGTRWHLLCISKAACSKTLTPYYI